MIRFNFWPASVPRSNCIEPRRSDIVLGIVDDLLVAVRAHLRSAREAYQLVLGMTAMDCAHQFGRALDALSILRLADPDARWCEVHDDPIKKGATRRDQRDEKHPFHYDGTHWFRSILARLGAPSLYTALRSGRPAGFAPAWPAQVLSGRPNSSCSIPTPSGRLS